MPTESAGESGGEDATEAKLRDPMLTVHHPEGDVFYLMRECVDREYTCRTPTRWWGSADTVSDLTPGTPSPETAAGIVPFASNHGAAEPSEVFVTPVMPSVEVESPTLPVDAVPVEGQVEQPEPGPARN